MLPFILVLTAGKGLPPLSRVGARAEFLFSGEPLRSPYLKVGPLLPTAPGHQLLSALTELRADTVRPSAGTRTTSLTSASSELLLLPAGTEKILQNRTQEAAV